MHMTTLLKVLSIWFVLNLAIPAFILWQRSPHFRHRVFRLTLGIFSSPTDRRLAHVLVEAAHHHRQGPPQGAIGFYSCARVLRSANEKRPAIQRDNGAVNQWRRQLAA